MLNSNEIRLLRHSRQVKQAEMAIKMKISKQRYSELESQTHSHLTPVRIEEILKLLGYTIETARIYLKSIPTPNSSVNINGYNK